MLLVYIGSTIIRKGNELLYCDYYHNVINLLCNNRDRQYIKYLILHIANMVFVYLSYIMGCVILYLFLCKVVQQRA